MATSFPSGLDALTNPTSANGLNSPDHAGQHSDANDAIEALEAKVGITSSAVTTSHDYLIKNNTPAGVINMWATTTAPTTWLLCDGAAVSRTTYAALFAVISTTYGAGDGSTTFNLPSLKGKVPVGRDSADAAFNTMGLSGGAKTHTLDTSEMPVHTHTQNAHTHTQDSHNHTQNAHNHAITDPGHVHNFNFGSGAGGGRA
jgi:microcystin-dependent protein